MFVCPNNIFARTSGDTVAACVLAVYSPEELLNEAYKLAHKCVDHRSPVAVALARQLMYRSAENHPIEAHKSDRWPCFIPVWAMAKKALNPF